MLLPYVKLVQDSTSSSLLGRLAHGAVQVLLALFPRILPSTSHASAMPNRVPFYVATTWHVMFLPLTCPAPPPCSPFLLEGFPSLPKQN